MLDISFYPRQGQPAKHIAMPDSTLEWLAHSEFSSIGQETETTLLMDEEPLVLPLVELNSTIRKQLLDFFNEAIVAETKQVLEQFTTVTVRPESVLRLQKLIAILDCLKNEQYIYLQRF